MRVPVFCSILGEMQVVGAFGGKCLPADVVNNMLCKGICMELHLAAVVSALEKRHLDFAIIAIVIIDLQMILNII